MKTRPFIPTLDELQALLDVESPGDLPDAVRNLQKQHTAYQHAFGKAWRLLDEIGQQIEEMRRDD